MRLGKEIHAIVAVATTALLVACSQADNGQADSGQADNGQELNVQAENAQAVNEPEWVLTNGLIYTVDANNSTAEAIVIDGNEIVYVGDNAGAEAMIGDGTEVIDLDGRMVLPGFVEGHFHATFPGILTNGVNLQSESMDELLGKLEEYAEENPDLEQIHGWGVRPTLYGDAYPTAAMLDAIVPARPVFLWQVDGHSSWVNSRTLEVAGITRDTPDTVPGVSWFVRDEDGNPTGYIIEVPAQLQVLNTLVTIDTDYVSEGAASWFAEYSAAGITAFHDFGIGGIPLEDGVEMFKDFAEDGTLTARFFGSYYWNDASIDPVPIATRLRDENQTGLVQFSALKINMDGDDDKWNALYVDGYADNPDAVPNPIIPFDVINDAAVRADAAGLHLLCHCYGDLAIRRFLDAVELAKNTNPEWDRRPVASHAQLVHPDDRPRFRELNATYDSSGQWFALDPYTGGITPVRLGPERASQVFPIKAILDSGANVSLGSDFPAAAYTSDYRPLNAITQAVTRQMLGRPDMPILGGEDMRLTVAEAIRANTYGAAYGIGVEDQIGSLEVGKLADLIVLDQNLFEIDPHDIYNTNVLLTIMDGEVRHRDGI